MTDAGEDAEKREPSYTVGGNVSWCSHSGKQHGDFLKFANRAAIQPSNCTTGIYPKDAKVVI